ncbi:Endonuclease/Exonuclease/phosphatase family protein [Histomonas meleagridis]|uniref:Endonuclease/Exonuclease/phosphatase family protein n=1 Tax=Histomonas meleagridis TaxID=135588 RepID=UPI00355ABA38|nr:Endonuclease/Exonuclease/phosphatase family protein [Histomonas meleagridis]KAH0800684.1 Endonuclease/Exonuclease/phosphatase family protein [Histomonas meleagridis]
MDSFLSTCGSWIEFKAILANSSESLNVGIALAEDSLFKAFLYFKKDNVIACFPINTYVLSVLNETKIRITFSNYGHIALDLLFPNLTCSDLINSQINVCRSITKVEKDNFESYNQSFLNKYGHKSPNENIIHTEAVPFFPLGLFAGARDTWIRRTNLQNFHFYTELADFPVFMVTWNVAQRPPESDTFESAKHIFTHNAKIVAIVLQEIDFSIHAVVFGDSELCQKWGEVFDQADENHLYEKIFEESLGGVYLRIVKLKDITETIKCETHRSVRLGVNGFGANKSAVLSYISINGNTTIAFIGCHLTPHNENYQKRNSEVNILLEEVSKTPYDYSVFFGDLNYRIDIPSEEVVRLIENNNIDELFKNEQLLQYKAENKEFSSYYEEQITFPPTYKFLEHCNNYNITRIPSYTDRILVHCSHPRLSVGNFDKPVFETDILRLSDVKTKFETESNFSTNEIEKNFPTQPKCTEYISYPDNMFSDHRPVSALYLFPVPYVIKEKQEAFNEIRMKKLNEITKLSFPKCTAEPNSFGITNGCKEVLITNVSCAIASWEVSFVPENVALEPTRGMIMPGGVCALKVMCNNELDGIQFAMLKIENGAPVTFEFWTEKETNENESKEKKEEDNNKEKDEKEENNENENNEVIKESELEEKDKEEDKSEVKQENKENENNEGIKESEVKETDKEEDKSKAKEENETNENNQITKENDEDKGKVENGAKEENETNENNEESEEKDKSEAKEENETNESDEDKTEKGAKEDNGSNAKDANEAE